MVRAVLVDAGADYSEQEIRDVLSSIKGLSVSTRLPGGSGYPSDGAIIAERLHPGITHEPTPYTASKRAAEWVVADGAVPYLSCDPRA